MVVGIIKGKITIFNNHKFLKFQLITETNYLIVDNRYNFHENIVFLLQ